jgi:hypothetical protein
MNVLYKARHLIAAAIFLFSAGLLSAQAWQVSVGALVEGNGNVRHGMGLAGGITVDTTITGSISAGIKIDAGLDFNDLVSFEPMLFGRWYFLKLGVLQFYAQAGAGAIVFIDDGRIVPAFTAEAGAGLRVSLKSLYIEPYVRSGYPTGIAAGVTLGYKFPPPRGVETPAIETNVSNSGEQN